MREIKFRGKSKSKGEWLYGDFITDAKEYNRTCDKAYILPHWDKLNCPIEVESESVGQYTNSPDRKGNEIFLGDIARRDFEIFETHWGGSEEGGDLGPTGEEVVTEGYFIGVVSQAPSGLYVLNKCSKYDAEGNFIKKCSHIKLHAKYAEVIGNVFENPELLEESQ